MTLEVVYFSCQEFWAAYSLTAWLACGNLNYWLKLLAMNVDLLYIYKYTCTLYVLVIEDVREIIYRTSYKN